MEYGHWINHWGVAFRSVASLWRYNHGRFLVAQSAASVRSLPILDRRWDHQHRRSRILGVLRRWSATRGPTAKLQLLNSLLRCKDAQWWAPISNRTLAVLPEAVIVYVVLLGEVKLRVRDNCLVCGRVGSWGAHRALLLMLLRQVVVGLGERGRPAVNVRRTDVHSSATAQCIGILWLIGGPRSANDGIPRHQGDPCKRIACHRLWGYR